MMDMKLCTICNKNTKTFYQIRELCPECGFQVSVGEPGPGTTHMRDVLQWMLERAIPVSEGSIFRDTQVISIDVRAGDIRRFLAEWPESK